MSSFNYKKWDNIDSDDSGDDAPSPSPAKNKKQPAHVPPSAPLPPPLSHATESASQISELNSLPDKSYAHMKQGDEVAKALTTPLPPTSKTTAAETADAPLSSPDPNLGPKMARKSPTSNRYVFSHNGTKIYEWEQTLSDVNIYIYPPSFIPSNQIYIKIKSHSLEVGIKNSETGPFMNELLFGLVDVGDSTWCITDDGESDEGGKVREINIVLVKGLIGEMWDSAMTGRINQPMNATEGKQATVLNPMLKSEVEKQLMLERFQNENPGFDFRGADFNGQVPNAREFMGGVRYEDNR